jgi:mannose/fructose/N-acetylgalactosamine-specific phosphotransferase system component IIB
MPIALYRIDDRLIHGQVVVGWGQPLDLGFIILVDDDVASSEWEQELYRMGVPPEMEVHFTDVASAGSLISRYTLDSRIGIVLVGDVGTMQRLIAENPSIKTVNVGGVHHSPGRTPRMRYVFLTPAEEAVLRAIAAKGVEVTAQDVPGARPIPLDELLSNSPDA